MCASAAPKGHRYGRMRARKDRDAVVLLNLTISAFHTLLIPYGSGGCPEVEPKFHAVLRRRGPTEDGAFSRSCGFHWTIVIWGFCRVSVEDRRPAGGVNRCPLGRPAVVRVTGVYGTGRRGLVSREDETEDCPGFHRLGTADSGRGGDLPADHASCSEADHRRGFGACGAGDA